MVLTAADQRLTDTVEKDLANAALILASHHGGLLELPVRFGDRVRVSFVALKGGHVCNRFTFPQLPFATFP
jgi:hypothetical protein